MLLFKFLTKKIKALIAYLKSWIKLISKLVLI